jgi:hypothetical protein
MHVNHGVGVRYDLRHRVRRRLRTVGLVPEGPALRAADRERQDRRLLERVAAAVEQLPLLQGLEER